MGWLWYPGLLLMFLTSARSPVGVGAARILCVSHQFDSHMAMIHAITEGMIDKGHEVYTVISDKMKVPPGLQDRGFKILPYHTPEGSTIMASGETANSVLQNALAGKKPNMRKTSTMAAGECRDMDNDVHLDKAIRNLKFDLFVLDMFPLSSCLYFMTLKYEVPFVTDPSTVYMEMMRTPILPSFIPSTTMLFSDKMTFVERVKNLYVTMSQSVPGLIKFPAVQDTTLVRKYSKDPEVTTWLDVARKAELFFVSRGGALEYPTPLTPNIINIECLTCKPSKPLEPGVKEMVEKSEGIIIVSFGSKISEFPDSIADKFLKAFAQRRETVIMRYTGKFKSSVPVNVKMMKWLPQNDLLGHNKTRLFITHAGNNGQYESLYHGVPMLCFPLFAEQPHNAFRTVDHGFGLKANIRTFTTEELVKQIGEIIETPSYRERIQKASRIMKSAHMDARAKTVYWMEYILEFGGVHLRSHGLKMPWYKYYMIDLVLAIQGILVVMVCFILGLCICFIKCASRCVPFNKDKMKTN